MTLSQTPNTVTLLCTADRGAATMMVNLSDLNEISSNGTYLEDQPLQSPLEGVSQDTNHQKSEKHRRES